MTNELLIEEALESGLNVRLRKNTLLDDGSLVAAVSNRTANVKSVLTSIKEDGTVSDTSLMLHHLQVYESKLLQLLGMGYAVKVLDLGVLRIKHKGKVSAESEANSLSNFTLAFTPSKKALEKVSGLSVDNVSRPDFSPRIESVTDLSRNVSDGTVTAGQPVRISGSRLKLGEQSDTLHFVPQSALGQDVQDEGLWIKVERDKVFRNKPRELYFFAPANLEADTEYRIRISTAYLASGKARKAPLVGESDIITRA